MRSFISLSVLTLFLLAFSPGDARKANDAYERGEYAQAVELYRSALASDPGNPRLHFNLGNSLANLGRTEEAIDVYEQFKALTDNPAEIALADYNIGNVLSGVEDLENAAEYYKRALINNSEDSDARHNYELALRQQQEQQQDQGDDENEDQQQDQDQQPEQGGENQDQEDQQQPDNQPESDQHQEGTRQDSPPQMSLDEAQNILEALEQRERDLLRDREKESQESGSDHEQDW